MIKFFEKAPYAPIEYSYDVEEILYKGKSKFQEIKVIRNSHFGKMLILDDVVQITERDEFFYHEMLVHPALMSHPEPKTCLIIGGGDGGTLREVLRHLKVQAASLVEIDGLVIEICQKYFPWLDAALKDRRAELVTADGNFFIENRDKTYDVVIIDSSEPLGPSSVLHGEAFYEKVKRTLNPGGIAAAQVGSPFFQLEAVKRMFGMLKNVFPVVQFYWGPVPTYPGGMWCYAFLSNERRESAKERDLPQGLRYYTPSIHRAAFALPGFLAAALDQ